MTIRLRQETALNLNLEGTTGSFRVGGRSGQQSLEVKYLLTNVGLDFSSGGNDPMLSALMPVREMFDPRTLDFDEIMQRDIDDARVSAELVPYLLDENSHEMIKLFPPIVVIVLPVADDANKPSPRYPAVTRLIERKGDYDYQIVRSGALGQEAFQFEQPIIDGAPRDSDLVRLRLNTYKTRLVIVDGQHRAMALLALYRNLREQWADANRQPYKEYYAEWTQNYIRQFNIEQVNLPVMLCTIPELDENYEGEYDLKRAARSIFLTLNKTARQVSESRNRLLDDNDLIAYFMRRSLSKIKQKDERDPFATRIWNVELDQHLNRVKLQNPIAITGVSHVYYLIEHMMMESGITSGIRPRSGKFAARTDLANCLDRLDGYNVLGSAVANGTRRDRFTSEAAIVLGDQFDERYGKFITQAYDRFQPYTFHCRACLDLRAAVERGMTPELLPILFDGQGIGRVFEDHRENLRQKLANGEFKTDVPEIRASATRLDSMASRLNNAYLEMRQNRVNYYLEKIASRGPLRADGGRYHDSIQNWITGLYEVYNTVAFQSALICGFFAELDRAGIRPGGGDGSGDPLVPLFDQYINQLNAFFAPTTILQLKKLLQVFYGEITGESPGDWRVAPSNQTFRSVVYRGEMQPDQWPKYKYLLLELWRPTDQGLADSVKGELARCRNEVFRDLYQSNQAAYLQEHRKLEEEITPDERTQIFDRSLNAYTGLLRNLGASPSITAAAMRSALSAASRAAEEQTNMDNSWHEEE